jgi:hypothetical protein
MTIAEAGPPSEPQSVQETGLDEGLLKDLALKLVYYSHRPTGQAVADALCLPFGPITSVLLQALRAEQLLEVEGASSGIENAYRYVVTGKGRERVLASLEASQYVGPAPVPLDAYRELVKSQSVQKIQVTGAVVEKALGHLVINKDILNDIGVAVNRCRSLFLWGEPGNGKTAIAEAISEMLPGRVYVPYAIACDYHIIRVFDATVHRPVAAERTTGQPRFDHRWVPCQRPFVSVGGEMQLSSLDLAWDEVSKFYEAPLQLKANGGMLLIDDFGRQQVSPRMLLNRWIVPLEKRVDYLNLRSGKKIDVPFDVLVVFSTNLEPRSLCDEAFLRRITNKILVPDPSREQFAEIFRRVCRDKGVPFSLDGFKYLYFTYYWDASHNQPRRPLRSCHPRDIVDQINSIARFRGVPPQLEASLLDAASRNTFGQAGDLDGEPS